jgi:thiamine transporter
MVECALMIALTTVLSMYPIFSMPMGGSVTLASMAPLVIASLRHGPKWGLLTGFTHGLIQMILGFENVMYCPTLASQIGCILLDYIVAFSVMGLSCVFAGIIPGVKANSLGGYAVGTAVSGILRFGCSFLSGILIWGGYAPEDMPVWLYSLQYNGSYMLPETIITVVAVVALMKVIERYSPAVKA